MSMGLMINDLIHTYGLVGYKIALNLFDDESAILLLPKSEFIRFAKHLGVDDIMTTKEAGVNSAFYNGLIYKLGKIAVITVELDDNQLEKK